MNPDHQILAHGGAMNSVDMLVGLGPVLLGAVLIVSFVLLLSFDRSDKSGTGIRDETPTSARLLFSGTYYHLEELLAQEALEPERVGAGTATAAGPGPTSGEAR